MKQQIQFIPGVGGRRPGSQNQGFSIKHIAGAMRSLPRVLRLVWSTNALLTALLGILSLLQGFTPAASVWISGLVIDSVVLGIRTHSTSPIWLPVGLQLAVALLSNLLGTFSNIVQQLLQEQVSNRVQLLILEKADTLDLAFFENPEFYDKLRQAADQSTYQPVSMISQTFDLFRTTVTLLSMIFLLLQLAWWLAIVSLIVPIPAFISSLHYGWRGFLRMRRQSPERRLMDYFNRLMTVDTYNKEIKLFTLGSFFTSRFRRLANKLYEEDKVLVVRRYLTNFLWSSLTGVANSAIYLYVALQVVLSLGRISLGSLTRYTQAALQAGQNFQGLLNGISSAYENNLYVTTLFEFLEYEPAIVSPKNPQPIDPSPEVTIHAGEAVAVVGRNGAGKTTIVKLLTRLYDPDEGEIWIGGRNIKEYDLKELREQVGVIFQDYVTYYLNARENIGVGRVAEIENQTLVSSAAQKSGANALIDKLPEGYETMLGRWFEKGTQLSGGEWQKVALARAFMRDARVLILDEPTSSLDAQAEYDVFAKFRVLTKGKTAIFISHRFSTVRLADRILVLENGQIIENGSHQELIALGGRYADLFNLQAEAYR